MIRTAEFHQARGAAFSLSGIVKRLRLWRDLARERRALARLDDARLRDIGLPAERAAQEAGRLFWDAPANRIRAGLN